MSSIQTNPSPVNPAPSCYRHPACDAYWHPDCDAERASEPDRDAERASKIGGAFGAAGAVLLIAAVCPIPHAVSGLLFWVAVPALTIGAVLTGRARR